MPEKNVRKKCQKKMLENNVTKKFWKTMLEKKC